MENNKRRPESVYIFLALFLFFYMATAMAERQRRGIEALACCFLCMATAMAERLRRGIEALACCLFLYGDCHGREAASRHRGSCLLLFSIWRLPWPRGSVAEALLLRHYLRLPINLCEPALIAFFHFYSSISSFCNLCFHSLYLSQRQ